MKQLSQVLDGVWYTLDEMWLLFEIATETVGSQYLQGADEYEVTQLAKEIITVYWFVFGEGVYIFFQQFVAQGFGKFSFSLP